MTNRAQLTERQRHLPDTDLVSSTGTREQLLRHGRALLLIVLHDVTCRLCMEFLRSLREVNDELDSWDMDVAVIAPDTAVGETTFRFFVDAEGSFALAMAIHAPAVMVVDRWRDVKELYDVGGNHNFPEADSLIAWGRYLATQCPECEGESL
jgi:hypothetical protein